MSKMAKLNSRKYRRVKDATRFIVCEQAFDVRDGDLAIAVPPMVHPMGVKAGPEESAHGSAGSLGVEGAPRGTEAAFSTTTSHFGISQ